MCLGKKTTINTLPRPLYSIHLQKGTIFPQVFLKKVGFKVQVTADSCYGCLLRTSVWKENISRSLVVFSPHCVTDALLSKQ